MESLKLFLFVFSISLVVSCGGGTATTSSGSTPSSITVTGTAATGSAIANATLTFKDATGAQVTVTTNAAGQYTLTTTSLTPPLLVKVSTAVTTPNYPASTVFYSVSADTVPSVINITPFTDLIVRNWYLVKGLNVDSVFAGSAPLLIPSVSEINTIEAVVKNMLSTWLTNAGLPTTTYNLITTPFNANGTGFDLLLSNTIVSINATTGNVTISTINPNSGIVSNMLTVPLSTNLTSPDTTPPSIPTGLSAISSGTASVVLVWNASTDNVGVAGYNIYRNGSKIGNSPYPAYSDTGLSSGTLYTYTVTAVDGALNESAVSNTATATTASVAIGFSQFDGNYTGSSTAGGVTITITATVSNGVISGTFTGQSASGPVSGSVSGSVSASGSVTMTFSNACSAIVTLKGQTVVTATGGAYVTGTASAPAVSTCAGVSAPWSATRITTATGVSIFNGNYRATITGTQTTGANAGAIVNSHFSFIMSKGVISSGPLYGTISPLGIISFTVPKNSTSLGVPCDDITFTGGSNFTLAGGVVMTGSWSSPGGAPDPLGTVCPAFSGTWSAATGASVFNGTYSGNWSLTCPACSDTATGSFSSTLVDGVFTNTSLPITTGTHGILFSSGTVSSSGIISGTGIAPAQCSPSVSTFTGQISPNSSGGVVMTIAYTRPASGTPGTSNRCEAESGTITATQLSGNIPPSCTSNACAISSTGTAVFSQFGTFKITVPTGVTSVIVQAWGAGGAGGTGTASTNTGSGCCGTIFGGGGGGGAYVTQTISVTPGTIYTLIVGAGGASASANGEASSFSIGSTVLVSAGGGSGGGAAIAFPATGGTGGTGGTATGGLSGGNGVSGSNTPWYSINSCAGVGGDGGNGANGGIGGRESTANCGTSGTMPTTPGGGGQGWGAAAGGFAGGATGQVTLTWK